MKVTVQVTGGLFGDDVLTSVEGDELTVEEDGKVRARRHLSRRSATALRTLVRQVAELDVVSKAEAAVDGGTTTIEIDDGSEHHTVVVAAGDDPPQAVWDLLDEVEALAATDETD